jgi:glycosyltransferase involved in cell wall biosynthesis
VIRIGIDVHGAGGHSLGLGNETYFLNLVRALLDIDAENEYHVFADHPEHVRTYVGDRPNLRIVTFAVPSQWVQRPFLLPFYARRKRLDVVHVPFVRPPFTRARVAVTVHDASYELLPGVYRRRERLRMKALVPWSCRRADLVLTVSEYARRQIHECYAVPLEKVVVTFNAADHMVEARDRMPLPSGFDLPRPYVLYCGLIQPRKNVARLVEAFDLFKLRTGSPHELVLAGKMGWHTGELERTLARLRHRDSIRFLGYVGNPMPLAPLLAGAELFAFPSLFESFGIPVLEAQIMGTPALVAAGTCFPEIFGDSVHYCDPLDVGSIADSIATLLRDATRRDELRRRGRERAQRYSWRSSAEIALGAYCRLAAGRSTPAHARDR